MDSSISKNSFHKKLNWIPCESQIDHVNTSVWLNWQERLFVERLEQKSKLISQLLEESKKRLGGCMFPNAR